jgi:hypothetical protein
MFRGLAATLSCGNFSAGVGKRPRNPGGGSGTAFREFQFGGALGQQGAEPQLRRFCVYELDSDLSVLNDADPTIEKGSSPTPRRTVWEVAGRHHRERNVSLYCPEADDCCWATLPVKSCSLTSLAVQGQ